MNALKLDDNRGSFRSSLGNKNWFLFEEKKFSRSKFCLFQREKIKKGFSIKWNQNQFFQNPKKKILKFRINLFKSERQNNFLGFSRNRDEHSNTRQFISMKKKKERRNEIFPQAIDLKFRAKKKTLLMRKDYLNQDPLLIVQLRCYHEKDSKNFHFLKKEKLCIQDNSKISIWQAFLGFLKTLEQGIKNSNSNEIFQSFKKESKLIVGKPVILNNYFFEIFENINHFYFDHNQKVRIFSDQVRKRVYYQKNSSDFNVKNFPLFFSEKKVFHSKTSDENFRERKNNLQILAKNLKFARFYKTEFGNCFFSKKTKKIQHLKPLCLYLFPPF